MKKVRHASSSAFLNASSSAFLNASSSAFLNASSRAFLNASSRAKARDPAGLTLIEVLIALAIVAIAMTAIIKATGQNIRGTNYLQTKTIALWVGQQALNEARIGMITVPNPPDKLKQKTTMLGSDWYWWASLSDTPNKNIKKIEVKVFEQDTDDDDATPVISLETYKYNAD